MLWGAGNEKGGVLWGGWGGFCSGGVLGRGCLFRWFVCYVACFVGDRGALQCSTLFKTFFWLGVFIITLCHPPSGGSEVESGELYLDMACKSTGMNLSS